MKYLSSFSEILTTLYNETFLSPFIFSKNVSFSLWSKEGKLLNKPFDTVTFAILIHAHSKWTVIPKTVP